MASRRPPDQNDESTKRVARQHGQANETQSNAVANAGAVRYTEGSLPRFIPPVVRSNPIAIVQKNTQQDSFDSSSEEEGDQEAQSNIRADLESLRINDDNASRSLPSRLLNAPVLRSLQRDVDEDLFRLDARQLPPPMPVRTIESGTPLEEPLGGLLAPNYSHTAYGSLRDSQMRGRFLDGPSSYRDAQTGTLHAKARVRFEGSQIASSAPQHSTLSIGERIQQRKRLQQANKKNQNNETQGTSTLAAMLASATDNQYSNSADATIDLADSYAEFHEQDEARLPSDMLSASLTALEILRQNRGGSVLQGSAIAESNEESDDINGSTTEGPAELPRTPTGLNALLSRSFSDPTPHLRRTILPSHSRISSPGGRYLTPPSHSPSILNLPPTQTFPSGAVGMIPNAIQHPPRYDTSSQEDDHEVEEGAFDLDME